LSFRGAPQARTRNPEQHCKTEIVALDSGSPLRGVRNDN
jgi:hypothetical protein